MNKARTRENQIGRHRKSMKEKYLLLVFLNGKKQYEIPCKTKASINSKQNFYHRLYGISYKVTFDIKDL